MIQAIRTNTAPATQAQTVNDEVLGGSTGLPNQTFQLAHKPVLDGTLQLQIDSGSGFEDWTRVEDFFGSVSGDHVYALDRSTGAVRFGDGVHGAIPVANANRPNNNVVARTYRYGGGKQGNLPGKKITTLVNSIPASMPARSRIFFRPSAAATKKPCMTPSCARRRRSRAAIAPSPKMILNIWQNRRAT